LGQKESSLDEKIERANQRLYYNRLKQRTPPPAPEPTAPSDKNEYVVVVNAISSKFQQQKTESRNTDVNF